MFRNVFPKIVPLLDNVEKYDKARQVSLYQQKSQKGTTWKTQAQTGRRI